MMWTRREALSLIAAAAVVPARLFASGAQRKPASAKLKTVTLEVTGMT
jgi:hypothetical protein